MLKDCIIIGGGVAGLSAAMRLTELGLSPLILEAGKFPAHRICGEFFSPECMPILKKWNIDLDAAIDHCRFLSNGREIDFALPKAAEGASRYRFDMRLVELVRQRGADVLTEALVTDLHHPTAGQDFYEVQLADGTCYQSKYLMIGAGRLPKMTVTAPKTLVYAGFKAHFAGLDMGHSLEMHCFAGGYAGISPIAPGVANVACLVRLDHITDKAHFMQNLMQHKGLQKLGEKLSQARPLFPDWLSGNIPEFGIRQNPAWPDVYWIGDAAGSIPPRMRRWPWHCHDHRRHGRRIPCQKQCRSF